MQATYDPADNKLRLDPDGKFDAETLKRVKDTGFRWAPKQKIFIAPAWNPSAEDIALELAGEIGDEDTTLVERADERSERFEDYSSKREAEAHQAHASVDKISERFADGQPIIIGHHSEKRARRDAEKIERGMQKAVKLWDASQYWQDRAAGAIRHARYKELPAVRARRIKGLEAEQRKHTRTVEESEANIRNWKRVLETPEANRLKDAIYVANYSRQTPSGTWTALTNGEMTAEEAAERAITNGEKVIAWANRWLQHIENRLTYERALLQESNTLVANLSAGLVKPEKGGAVYTGSVRLSRTGIVEWLYVDKVNKITVSVTEVANYGGGRWSRKIPLDKIKGMMSAAEVKAAMAAGNLTEKEDKTGFYTRSERPEPIIKPEVDATGAKFGAMKESLKAGIQVVTGPELFPTPRALADRMVELADIRPGMTVLEPSAGTGRILEALPCIRPNGSVVAVELDFKLAEAIRKSGQADDVFCSNFLSWKHPDGHLFDRVVMNPPFSNGQDTDHILHNPG